MERHQTTKAEKKQKTSVNEENVYRRFYDMLFTNMYSSFRFIYPQLKNTELHELATRITKGINEITFEYFRSRENTQSVDKTGV